MKNHTYFATENDTAVIIECEVLPLGVEVKWLWNGSPLDCQNETNTLASLGRFEVIHFHLYGF